MLRKIMQTTMTYPQNINLCTKNNCQGINKKDVLLNFCKFVLVHVMWCCMYGSQGVVSGISSPPPNASPISRIYTSHN